MLESRSATAQPSAVTDAFAYPHLLRISIPLDSRAWTGRTTLRVTSENHHTRVLNRLSRAIRRRGTVGNGNGFRSKASEWQRGQTRLWTKNPQPPNLFRLRQGRTSNPKQECLINYGLVFVSSQSIQGAYESVFALPLFRRWVPSPTSRDIADRFLRNGAIPTQLRIPRFRRDSFENP